MERAESFQPAAIAYCLRRLVPGRCEASIQLVGDFIALLHEEERRAIVGASARRAWQFASGRIAASTALKQLHAPSHAILRGPSGEPVCPPPWRVSIAHTREIALAVAWNADQGPDLGVDIEFASDVTSDLAGGIASTEEQAAVADLDFGLAVLFSAKESAIKALRRFPRSGFHALSSRRLAADRLMLTAASPGGAETNLICRFAFCGPWVLSCAVRAP